MLSIKFEKSDYFSEQYYYVQSDTDLDKLDPLDKFEEQKSIIRINFIL
jgi:hypothetical protein